MLKVEANNEVVPVGAMEFHRRLQGRSLRQLALQLEISSNRLSRYERGKDPIPDGDAKRIAKALGTTQRAIQSTTPRYDGQAVRASYGTLECSLAGVRRKLGRTRKDLAKRTGIPARQIAEFERAGTAPSLEEALCIAEELGVPVERLFARKRSGPVASHASQMLGLRFGRLTVEAPVPDRNSRQGAAWLCRCDCGNKTVVRMDHLKSGHTASCGCESGKRR